MRIRPDKNDDGLCDRVATFVRLSRSVLAAFLAVAASAGVSAAQHSFVAEFDEHKPVQRAGAVTCGRTITLADGRSLSMALCSPPGRSDRGPIRRIRFKNDRIAEGLTLGMGRSAAFRELVLTIEAADVLVFVLDRRCEPKSVRSCLNVIANSGGHSLSISLDMRQPLFSVVRQLAHELQHVVEIIAAGGVADGMSLRTLYERIGFRNCWGDTFSCWETRKAQAMESLVLNEIYHAAATPGVDRAFFGTWTLNVGQSAFENVSKPTEGTRVHGDRGYGLISVVINEAGAAGAADCTAFVYRPDGIDYRLEGGIDSSRTIALTPIDRFAAEFVLKEGGEIVATGRQTLDRHGRTLTIETYGTNADGQPTKSITVWEKRSGHMSDEEK